MLSRLDNPVRYPERLPISDNELVAILRQRPEENFCPKESYDLYCDPDTDGCTDCSLNPDLKQDVLNSFKKQTIERLRNV